MFADLKAAWSAGSNNNISLIAAGIAHYALLALVPALAALVLGYGLFANPDTVAADIQFLSKNLPQAAASLIGDELRNLTGGPGKAKGLGLLGSLAIALFGARSAAMALMTGLNITFHAGEPRSFVRGNLVALAITIGGIVGLAIMGGASAALAVLSGPAGSILGFIVLAAGAVGGAAALYRFAPNRPSPEWSAVLPGAVLFAFGWIVATAAFAFYAANFGSYNATYGSLGAVVVLITWFYATAFLLLLGAELAAVKGRGKDVSPSKAS